MESALKNDIDLSYIEDDKLNLKTLRTIKPELIKLTIFSLLTT